MITKFEISSRNGTNVWDVSKAVTSVKWTTDLNFSAGTLDFDVLKSPVNDFYPVNGNVVDFWWDDNKVFYGYVFSVTYNQDHKFSVKAYDKTRYLKNKDSLVWPISSISDRFNTVCGRALIDHAIVEWCDYKLPAQVEDSKTYFDMLKDSIDQTQKATGQMYYIFANYNYVELRKAPFKELPLIIGDKSLLTGFELKQSIDDAVNAVRVVQENQQDSQQVSSSTDISENGGKDPDKTSYTYIDAYSKETTPYWGWLQDVVNAKDKANSAQLRQQALDTLSEKNFEDKTLKLDTVGNIDLVAGNAINFQIAALDQVGFYKQHKAAILKATHNFGVDYTCELEMKVNAAWLANNSSA